jgi:hypothetical protein
MMSHHLTTTAAFATCIALSGCAMHLNRIDGLYGTSLAALHPAPVSSIDDQPSITAGHDRSHWRATTIQVPMRQVEHHPHYVREFLLEPSTNRAAGDFPTTSTALQIDPRTIERSLESPLNIIGAGVLLVWAPIDMAINARPPLTAERGSASAYQRLVMIDDPDQFRRWIDVDTDAAQERDEELR